MREVASIKQNKNKFSVLLLILFSFWLMAFCLILPEAAAQSALRALFLCAKSVVPSLAVFMICSKILIKTGFCEKLSRTPLRHLCPRLGISCGGLTAFLVGLISGFPMGAVILSELVLRGEISKEEARQMMPFCNNAGPAFVIGTVGAAFFGSVSLGAVLFAAQTAAAVTAVLLTAKRRRMTGAAESILPAGHAPKQNISAARIVSSSVSESALSLVSVCGFVVFFTVLSDSFLVIWKRLAQHSFGAILRGVFEISGGLSALGETGEFPFAVLLAVCGGILGFGGISVWMQAADRAEAGSIPMEGYLSGRMLCSLLCALYAVLFGASPQKSFSSFAVILMLLAGLLLYAAVVSIKNKGFFKKRVEK